MRVIPRSEWGARPARSRTVLRSPLGVAVHWEGPHMGPFGHEQCARRVLGIQRFHMETRGWADIAYSFVVCPHGRIFEGRGWEARTAANGTNVGNATFLAACYLSGDGDPFTDEAKAAYEDLFAEAARRGAPQVRPHSSFKPTACPGDVIRRWLADRTPLEDDMTDAERELLHDTAAAVKRIEAAIFTGGGEVPPIGALVAETNARTARQGEDLGKLKQAAGV